MDVKPGCHDISRDRIPRRYMERYIGSASRSNNSIT